MSEEEKRDRLGMLGPGIPSITTLNRAPDDERLDRGGMSAPLTKAVVRLAQAFDSRMGKMLNQQLPPLPAAEVGARHALLGFARPAEEPSSAVPVFPRKPAQVEREEWVANTAWWLREPPPVEEVPVQQVGAPAAERILVGPDVPDVD